MALMLSAIRGFASFRITPNSWRSCGQITSLVAEDIKQCSASAQNLDTIVSFLLFLEFKEVPSNMHQAVPMDRAHRLGQRKFVNVYRLIMHGTLEEKVMSLQKFKVSVANAVINAENTSLNTMNTDQLLDLFTSSETGRKGATTQSKSSNGSLYEDPKMGPGVKGLKTILSGLEELWDQSQYTEEYNLSQF